MKRNALILLGCALLAGNPLQAEEVTPPAVAETVAPERAPVPPMVDVDVRVVLAKRGQPFVDPGLQDVKAYLVNGLGSRFSDFRLLTTGRMSLAEKQVGTTQVPEDGAVTLKFLGVKEAFLRFKAEFKDLSLTIALNDGGYFIQAGRKHKDGYLVYVIGTRLR
jgi:hypothetical protein